MATTKPPPDPQIIQMVMGWVDNYIANIRKMFDPLGVAFDEWMKKKCPPVQKLDNFNVIGKVFGHLLDGQMDFKVGGRARMNDPAKFAIIWNTWEQVITQRTALMEQDALARGDNKMLVLTRCMAMMTQVVHDEPKDGKQLPKVLAEMMTKLFEEIKKRLPKK